MEVRAELILFSKEFPVEEVFREIDIDTGSIDICDEMIYKTISGEDFKKEQECSISYSTQIFDTIHVVDVLSNLCSFLKDKVHIIKSLIDRHQLTAKICITLNLTDVPELIFAPEFVQMAASLGCSVEIDTYLDVEKTVVYDDSDTDNL